MTKNEILSVGHDNGIPFLQINKISGLKINYSGTVFITVEVKGRYTTVSLKPGKNSYRELYKVLGGEL